MLFTRLRALPVFRAGRGWVYERECVSLRVDGEHRMAWCSRHEVEAAASPAHCRITSRLRRGADKLLSLALARDRGAAPPPKSRPPGKRQPQPSTQQSARHAKAPLFLGLISPHFNPTFTTSNVNRQPGLSSRLLYPIKPSQSSYCWAIPPATPACSQHGVSFQPLQIGFRGKCVPIDSDGTPHPTSPA